MQNRKTGHGHRLLRKEVKAAKAAGKSLAQFRKDKKPKVNNGRY